MALGSTQPLTEMSTGVFPGDKGDRCVRLTTYHHPVPLSRNLGTLTSRNPLGLSRPVMGLLYLYQPEPTSALCFVPAGLVVSARRIHPTASVSSALLRMASTGDCSQPTGNFQDPSYR